MSTIYNVAERAGVSPITVSRVINNSGYVSEKTREKVMRAIEELQYVPNELARSLKGQRTHTIALVITDVTNPFFTTVARGVEDIANQNGYSVILCNTDENLDKEKFYINKFLSKRVDGAIIATASGNSQHLLRLKQRDFPFVLIDRMVEALDVDIVRGDNVRGAYELTTHLIELGHRRIALINGPCLVSSAQQRLEGFMKALQDHGLPLDESLIKESNYKRDGGYESAIELLKAPELPTAIFAANNLLAIGAIVALREHGLRVPGDISLVSFDDIELASLIYPFLTVVNQPAYTMGTLAMQLLLDRMSDQPINERRDVVLQPEMVIRCSTAPPAHQRA